LLKKRIIITLTFLNGVLFRTKKFKPDYRYTKNFIDLWSIDELILIDISKNKFSNTFLDLVKFFSKNCFVPISVGGGIESIINADTYFRYGADKIVLGSNSINKQNLVKEISNKYGNQSIIQSVDCKKKPLTQEYTVMGKSGKIDLLIDPVKFSLEMLSQGVGEIMINNIDSDGSLLGYDIKLIELISSKVKSPILALGGGGSWTHILDLFQTTDISGACTQNIFHFTEESILSAKSFLKKNDINVRN